MIRLNYGMLIAALFIISIANALPLQLTIGDSHFRNWKGIQSVDDGIATLQMGQLISYRYPDGKLYPKGFRYINEGVSDWSQYDGVRFEVYLKEGQMINLDICLKVPDEKAKQLIPETHARISVTDAGWHTVMLDWKSFEISEAQRLGVLRSVKEMAIRAEGAGNDKFQLKNVKLVQGEQLSLRCDIKGRSVRGGETATYKVLVGNTTDRTEAVNLLFDKYGWEGMTADVTPNAFYLKPGESRICEVKVTVPSNYPGGRREKQILQSRVNGQKSGSLSLITASYLPSPNILHTSARWQEVKEKAAKYDWAKKELQEYEDLAGKWVVPNYATGLSYDNTDKGMHLFSTQEEYNFMAAGISYQLTGRKEYAEKVALFMRRLSDPVKGYPCTFRACNQSSVQEGHFFQHIAMTYDMVRDAGVFTEEDINNIERTLRLYYETVELGMGAGAINNWALSSLTGALYCALALQDWDLVEKMLNSPGGILDHMAQGIMNDGWWYECTISYNVWCASEFSQAALALEPWGINLKDLRVPTGTTKNYSLMPEFMVPGLYGMNFEKWGPVTKNSIGIKDMWDALPAFADFRGMMFGVNDTAEKLISGEPYELAYYMYRDPEYAAIIRRGTTRDLLYGVPELPDTTSLLQTKSAYADNIGIVMLRSQTENRPIREQIQAALHYGTHGGFHGHFDRTNFLHMSRYGRSFYNPEMIFYGYPSYLYKFLIQTSMTKNMVVVDQKMQEPKESFRTLFYTGKMMSATAVETNARWSNPPYGGMIYDWAGEISFKEKAFQEGRSIEYPKTAPEYGTVTNYTEPVLQRRLMVMMDDYVVLADYLKSEKEHTFDWLFHMKGFAGLTASKKEFVRHDDRMNADPLGSAQFFTDCNWWKTRGAVTSEFSMCWGKGCDNAGTLMPNSEDGELKVNVTTAWPLQNEIMIGTTPEAHDVHKQLFYKISADENLLKSDSTGAWILGQANINIELKGVKELKLETRSKLSGTSNLFWANARVVLSNGREVLLSELPLKTVNVKPTTKPGLDYYGGPVKIGGHEYKNVLPAMAEKIEKEGVITIDLTGFDAVRFKAVLGADYPLGDEKSRHKTLAVRTKGKVTRYLSVIEPFEKESVIRSIEATDPDHLKITLKDGRVQEITIFNLDDVNRKIRVSVKEEKNEKLLRDDDTSRDLK